jgi:hypothetical protein
VTTLKTIAVCLLEIFVNWNTLHFMTSMKSLGTDFSEARCIPKSSVKIAWHEWMKILFYFCRFPHSQSTIFTYNAFHLGKNLFHGGKIGPTSHRHLLKLLRFGNICVILISASHNVLWVSAAVLHYFVSPLQTPYCNVTKSKLQSRMRLLHNET